MPRTKSTESPAEEPVLKTIAVMDRLDVLTKAVSDVVEQATNLQALVQAERQMQAMTRAAVTDNNTANIERKPRLKKAENEEAPAVDTELVKALGKLLRKSETPMTAKECRNALAGQEMERELSAVKVALGSLKSAGKVTVNEEKKWSYIPKEKVEKTEK